jgi:hypothetical protein
MVFVVRCAVVVRIVRWIAVTSVRVTRNAGVVLFVVGISAVVWTWSLTATARYDFITVCGSPL